MINIPWKPKGRSPLIIMLGVGCLLLVGGGAAYQLSTNRPNQQSASVNAAPTVETVSALGRLEPEGEVIQVFAPTSMEGARVETLRVTHGQQIRKGDVIAVLDTYTRRQAAVQEALEQVEVAQAQLSQVEAGAKSGQIRAQSRVVDRQQVELQTETEAQEATIARLKAELNNAELEARRYQVLYTDGAVSASLRDGKQLTADIVRQQLNGSQANLSRNQRSRSLISLDRFTDRRLYQAAGITGVASVSPIYLNSIQWRNPENKEIWDIYTIGINPEHQVLNIAGVEANREKLRQPDTVLFNLGSRREFGAIAERFQSGEAITTEINERQVQIQGLFKLSPTFGINAYLVTSDVNFLRMAPFRQGGLVDVGVIKLKPDADVQAVLAEMRSRLPDDVKVMTRDDYAKAEVAFWSASTPVGYTFDLGVVIAFIVGSVIVYQILYSDVTDHLPEYATLKAMGFRDRYLLIVVFQEALILAAFGFIPGTLIALGIYRITNLVTMLPMAMDLGRIVFVFILTAIMSSLSAAIAVRKLQTADPADIF